jgi:hypothetical protein
VLRISARPRMNGSDLSGRSEARVEYGSALETVTTGRENKVGPTGAAVELLSRVRAVPDMTAGLESAGG